MRAKKISLYISRIVTLYATKLIREFRHVQDTLKSYI